jgi:hypothetical protein
MLAAGASSGGDVVRKSGAPTGATAHELVISNSQHWLLQTDRPVVGVCVSAALRGATGQTHTSAAVLQSPVLWD